MRNIKKKYLAIIPCFSLVIFCICALIWTSRDDKEIDFTHANNVTGFDHYIVPNIVHFVRLENHNLSLMDLVVLKSVQLHQSPDKIIIHCDCLELGGKFWPWVKKEIPNLEVRFVPRPTYIFDIRISSVYHASDITRIRILREQGGIFLDNDVYVVRSLNPYRRFEMAIGWPPNQNLGTQVLVAHKDARFLRLWLMSYRYYKPRLWYYNAGELPTQSILSKKPELVHRVPYDFGVHDLTHLLYGVRSADWRNFCAIHLLSRHRHYLVLNDPLKEDFDEDNIMTYNRTFGDMARSVLCGSENCTDWNLD